MESGIGEAICCAANQFINNQSVVNLVLDILEGLFILPDICQFFCICNYSQVLQSFFTFSIQDENYVCKALKCTIALATVDSRSLSLPSL